MNDVVDCVSGVVVDGSIVGGSCVEVKRRRKKKKWEEFTVSFVEVRS